VCKGTIVTRLSDTPVEIHGGSFSGVGGWGGAVCRGVCGRVVVDTL